MTSNAARRQKAAAQRSDSSAAPAGSAASLWQLRRPDGTIAFGWYLLPLRLFLGATFLFAGLQKLANPNFLRNTSPISIHSQLLGASHTSPIGSLLGHLVGAAPVLGLLIALGEVAIGVGALLGLLTRIAAIGGMVLAFGLFLAISFHTSPYYSGSDIVFLFAWTPFVLAGAGGAPALDTMWEQQAASTPADQSGAVMSRGAVIGLVAGGAAVLAGAVAGLGRIFAPASTNTAGPSVTTSTTTAPTATTAGGTPATSAPTTTTASAPTPKGTSIGPSSTVPVGGSASFNDPKTGDPSLVIQHTSGNFVAFDAICPHAGCTVAYQGSANVIVCPCHGSEFSAKTGAVTLGPATTGLTPIKVIKGANGDLYVV